MKLGPNGARWIGGICIGVVLDATLRGGWGAIALLGLGLLGRYLVTRLGNTIFDDEVTELKQRFAPKDPVKQAILSHVGHEGRFKDCTRPSCLLY